MSVKIMLEGIGIPIVDRQKVANGWLKIKQPEGRSGCRLNALFFDSSV